MASNASQIADAAGDYADKKYREAHDGSGYAEDMRKYLEIMTDIASRHADEMTDDAKKQLKIRRFLRKGCRRKYGRNGG